MGETEYTTSSDDADSSDAAAQMKIKNAVSGNNEPGQREILNEKDTPTTPMTAEYDEMQGSVMSRPAQQEVQEPAPPETPQYEINYTQPPEEQAQQAQQTPQEAVQPNYEGYNAYQPVSISPDTMSEVAEQVIAEKLNPIARSIDKLLDAHTSFESQIKYVEDRVKRLEKIIDSLQLSLLQRVGEYVNNVSDIKTELAETQKTFKAMLNQKDKSK